MNHYDQMDFTFLELDRKMTIMSTRRPGNLLDVIKIIFISVPTGVLLEGSLVIPRKLQKPHSPVTSDQQSDTSLTPLQLCKYSCRWIYFYYTDCAFVYIHCTSRCVNRCAGLCLLSSFNRTRDWVPLREHAVMAVCMFWYVSALHACFQAV